MLYRFAVQGKGDFPFSMLSISKAYPVDANAAHHIALSCPTVAPEQVVWLESRDMPNSKLWANDKWPIQKIVT
jgi:hypothetical protein